MGVIWRRIKEANLGSPNFFIFLISAIAFLIVTVIVNQLQIVYGMWFSLAPWMIIGLVILNIIVAVLFGTIINLMILRIKESRKASASMGVAPVGIFAGILGGACPGCFTGLLPTFLALLGTGIAVFELPLRGAEFLIGSIILMSLSVYLLAKPANCKVKVKKKKK